MDVEPAAIAHATMKGPAIKYAVGDKIKAFIDDKLMEGTIIRVIPSFSYRVRTSTGDEIVDGSGITGKVSGGRRRGTRKTRRSRK
jgi:hypothetical protein